VEADEQSDPRTKPERERDGVHEPIKSLDWNSDDWRMLIITFAATLAGGLATVLLVGVALVLVRSSTVPVGSAALSTVSLMGATAVYYRIYRRVRSRNNKAWIRGLGLLLILCGISVIEVILYWVGQAAMLNPGG
jgi:hypothetical protein